MGKTRKKERTDELNHRAPAIIVEETYWIDIDHAPFVKKRNRKRLNDCFGPRKKTHRAL